MSGVRSNPGRCPGLSQDWPVGPHEPMGMDAPYQETCEGTQARICPPLDTLPILGASRTDRPLKDVPPIRPSSPPKPASTHSRIAIPLPLSFPCPGLEFSRWCAMFPHGARRLMSTGIRRCGNYQIGRAIFDNAGGWRVKTAGLYSSFCPKTILWHRVDDSASKFHKPNPHERRRWPRSNGAKGGGGEAGGRAWGAFVWLCVLNCSFPLNS